MRYTRLGALALALAIAGGSAACTTPTPPLSGRTPVMFVHGYLGTEANWATPLAQFRAAGYTDGDLDAITYDYNASVETTAPKLAAAVDALRARTGAAKVDIVSYSLGSLVTKQCIIVSGCQGKVEHWMSISGVDNGTEVELATAKGTASNEDVQGRTPVIANLQARWSELVAQGVKVEVQWTLNDGIVKPSDRSKQPAPAVNRQVSGLLLNHLTMPTNQGVISETIRFLGTPP